MKHGKCFEMADMNEEEVSCFVFHFSINTLLEQHVITFSTGVVTF